MIRREPVQPSPRATVSESVLSMSSQRIPRYSLNPSSILVRAHSMNSLISRHIRKMMTSATPLTEDTTGMSVTTTTGARAVFSFSDRS